MPAFLFLQMADKHKRSSLLVIIIFLCVTQAKFGQLDYKRWNSTSYLSVGQNESGIEWWKRGSMSPRLYSWQPNHGDRGKHYTKKPKPNPKFGSGNSSEISSSKDSLIFPPGFNKTVARNVAHTLKSAFHRALITKLSAVSKAVSNADKVVEESRSSKVAPLESRSLTRGAIKIPSRDKRFEAKKLAFGVPRSNLTLPIIPHMLPKPYHPFQEPGIPFLDKVNMTTLTSESNARYAERRSKRERRQTTPDAITELNLNQDQLRDLKSRVHRRFLVGYDCSKPMDVKPVSSFIHDPCEPVEANSQDNYDIEKVTQFQIVQYETRREYLGTRCERYISQFTYYCGNADHASPLPQETFYRRPKVLGRNECRAMEMGSYKAGNGKMYSITRNVRKEISYFARGTANAYSGWDGTQVTCTGGKLLVDGLEINNMVMYVTEELLHRDEKFISREEDDGVIAHYNNVRLTCPAEDGHCVGGDVTYVWRIPLQRHCPLYHVRKFKGQIIKYELSGLTIKTHRVALSTDHSHVRFVIKGTRSECGQEFLTTNYPDLLIRDTIVDGVPDRNLITRKLPKDELKLSNFITNRDDFVYHEITRNLRREFASVIHDECQENLRKTRTEHFLDREMPNFHTYRLGGSNYLTAAGEVAYFYKCRPRLVAAIRAQTCYDALPVEIAHNNYTLTSYTQEDGEEVVAPRYYIEPLTHRITSVAKKVPCISQFFARYKDIFGQWFAVTPQLSITEPPAALDLESLQKKAHFDHENDIDLSRGGVYDPDAVDDLISWLESNRRQEVIVHQLADQVGNLNPGEYITPKLMFPSYTLPGGSWHKFILGKIWGAIRGLGEIFSTIFGLFIVGRLVWYLIKVLMNCGYIHSVHGCSPKLAWSLCTEVLFTHNYRKVQRQQRPTAAAGRSDNDPSERPRKRRRTIPDKIRGVFSGDCLKGPESSSDDEAGNTPSAQAARQEMSDMIQRQADRIQHQADRIAQVRRVHAEVSALHNLEGSPPPYVTPPGSAAYPNAPRVSPMRTLEPESERATYQADGRMLYTRTAPPRRFAFTPVNSLVPPETSTLPTPPPSTSDDNP